MDNSNTNVDWEALKDYVEKWKATQSKQDICPQCGYCPHCGRSGHQVYPYYPQPYWYPYTITWVDNTYNDGHTVTCNHG